ncbi:MAG: DNA topoisomerase III [Andreesenia angusta]|nr:DNA topoisomerase III [Andreesenia angusta]
MKKLVIAEKPSVGRDIAKAINANSKRNGFMEGKNYIVTWALGHLVTLANPEAYSKKYASWRSEDLPILPDRLKTIVIKKTSKQFNTIKSQLNRKDVNEIVIATDAGREGELVARWIIEKSRVKKPIKRLWISSVTEKAIKDGFRNLKDGRKYDNLYRSAEARAEADWYVGINGTRALTCKYNAQLSCGRVQTPTLAMVERRENDINNFVPKEFYGIKVELKGNEFEWRDRNNSNRSFDQEKIDKLITKIEKSKVESVEKRVKRKKQYPPALYDLTELQKDANRIYGFSGKETLNTMQSLYESHKVLTYPRTDSRYLTKDIISTLKERIRAVSIDKFSEYSNMILKKDFKYNKSIINDSKVTDHHAIIPTEEKASLQLLNDREWKIYDLVVSRFLSNMMEPCEYEETRIDISIAGEKFTTKVDRDINIGWKIIYQDKKSSLNNDFGIKKGDSFTIKKTKGETSPPSRYTEGTLLGAMENPASHMDIKDSKAVKTLGRTGGIGTVATRADILDKLFNSFLIEKRGQDIFITSKGRQLLNLVPEDLKSPVLTAEWEMKLEKIAEGKLNVKNFIDETKNYTKEIVKEIKLDESKFRHDNITGSKCPECGKYMLDVNGKKGKMLVCQDRECGYREVISTITNARCPNCRKKLELRGRGDKKIFTCKCGYRERLSTFNERKKKRGAKVSKREVKQYLNKQKDEPINSALADALSKLDL